ncbi:conserved hypothetical protein [Cupriavidus taiwanensis]|nr:conserved hypothetical protein [Cupriavidus taiwanensis]
MTPRYVQGRRIEIDRKPTRQTFLQVLTRLQDLVGQAENAVLNDRDRFSTDKALAALREAHELCIQARSFDPPTDVLQPASEGPLPMSEPRNRERMRELCGIAGSQSEAARLITKHTHRPCSTDAVKSWTCDAESARARVCQDWAVEALEKELRKLKMLA